MSAQYAGSQLSTPCKLPLGPYLTQDEVRVQGCSCCWSRFPHPTLSHGSGGSYPIPSMQSMINYRVSH